MLETERIIAEILRRVTADLENVVGFPEPAAQTMAAEVRVAITELFASSGPTQLLYAVTVSGLDGRPGWVRIGEEFFVSFVDEKLGPGWMVIDIAHHIAQTCDQLTEGDAAFARWRSRVRAGLN